MNDRFELMHSAMVERIRMIVDLHLRKTHKKTERVAVVCGVLEEIRLNPSRFEIERPRPGHNSITRWVNKLGEILDRHIAAAKEAKKTN